MAKIDDEDLKKWVELATVTELDFSRASSPITKEDFLKLKELIQRSPVRGEFIVEVLPIETVPKKRAKKKGP